MIVQDTARLVGMPNRPKPTAPNRAFERCAQCPRPISFPRSPRLSASAVPSSQFSVPSAPSAAPRKDDAETAQSQAPFFTAFSASQRRRGAPEFAVLCALRPLSGPLEG